MEYIYVARSEDRKKILENFEKFKELSDGEIKLKFEREKKLGIVGVHDQILYLIALRKVIRYKIWRIRDYY